MHTLRPFQCCRQDLESELDARACASGEGTPSPPTPTAISAAPAKKASGAAGEGRFVSPRYHSLPLVDLRGATRRGAQSSGRAFRRDCTVKMKFRDLVADYRLLAASSWCLERREFFPVRGATPGAPQAPYIFEDMLLPRRSAIFLRRSAIFLGAAGMLSSAAASTPARLRPMVPPDLDASQQRLYDTIVDTRIDVVGRAALFDEHGALRGPWNAEVASPALGQHLERLATAVRSENSLEPRLYEVTAL